MADLCPRFVNYVILSLITVLLGGRLCQFSTLVTKLRFDVEIGTDVYTEAERKCNEKFGHLIDMRSQFLFSALNQLKPHYADGSLSESMYFYTGLTRTHPGASTFSWYDGEIDTDSFSLISYTYEGGDDSKDCVCLQWSKRDEIWTLQMANCIKPFHWICQIQTTEPCRYCFHPGTEIISSAMSGSGHSVSNLAECEDSCSDVTLMPGDNQHCWFYSYNAMTSSCLTFRDPHLVDIELSGTWFQANPDWETGEKQCISVQFVSSGTTLSRLDRTTCALPTTTVTLPKTTVTLSTGPPSAIVTETTTTQQTTSTTPQTPTISAILQTTTTSMRMSPKVGTSTLTQAPTTPYLPMTSAESPAASVATVVNHSSESTDAQAQTLSVRLVRPTCACYLYCTRNRSGAAVGIEQILNNLTLDYKSLSSYVRQYTSAPDERLVSKGIGVFALLLLIVLLLFIIVSDSGVLYRDLKALILDILTLVRRSE